MPAEDKASSGQRMQIRAAAWNRMVDAADWWHEQQRLAGGVGSANLAGSVSSVKVQNDTAASRRRGEVMELSTSGLLSDDEYQPGKLWFRGQEPEAQGLPFGVLRDPLGTSAIGDLQLIGVCLALVDVQDQSHGFARLVDGSHVLESAAAGQVSIIWKPSGTGEQTCAVLLGGSSEGIQIGKLDGTLSQGSYANATRWQRNSAGTAWEATSPTVTDVVYDWLLPASESITSGSKIIYFRHSQSGLWLVQGAECP